MIGYQNVMQNHTYFNRVLEIFTRLNLHEEYEKAIKILRKK